MHNGDSYDQKTTIMFKKHLACDRPLALISCHLYLVTFIRPVFMSFTYEQQSLVTLSRIIFVTLFLYDKIQ